MESKTLVLLAGGAASRLNSFLNTQNKVKCLVSFEGIIFLRYLLAQAVEARFRHVVILGGPNSQLIEEEVRKMDFDLRYSFPQEKERLGTGGALSLISGCIHEEYIFLSNADTYFLQNPFKIIKNQTMKVGPINYFMRDRHPQDGFVELCADDCITWPDLYQTGSHFYTGISLIKSDVIKNWSSLGIPTKCSFEKDVFAKLKVQASFASYPFKEIDFGTEAGYKSLQAAIKKEVV